MCPGQVGGVTCCSDHDHLLRCGQAAAPRLCVIMTLQCTLNSGDTGKSRKKDMSDTVICTNYYFLGKTVVNQYFGYILSLVTDNSFTLVLHNSTDQILLPSIFAKFCRGPEG